jgi:hypothetical protein
VNILNTYAIANTPDAVSMADVYNDTVIVNEFDTSEFVYNKIAEVWVKYPNGYLTIATNDHLGVVKGTQPSADPTDESKDTYMQVLADGTMKLVGDRLGKVNTVDGVAPDANKDIELTVEMTRAEHDALEDPAGSGKYPSLAGKTVTLKDVYPSGRVFESPDWSVPEAVAIAIPSSPITVNYGSPIYTATENCQLNNRFSLTNNNGTFFVMYYKINGQQLLQFSTDAATLKVHWSDTIKLAKGDTFQIVVNMDAGTSISINRWYVNKIPFKYTV